MEVTTCSSNGYGPGKKNKKGREEDIEQLEQEMTDAVDLNKEINSLYLL